MQTKVPKYIESKKYTKDKLMTPINVGNSEQHLGGLEPSAIETIVRSLAAPENPFSFFVASAPCLDIEFVAVISFEDKEYIFKICGVHCEVCLKLGAPYFRVLNESLFFIEGNTTTQ